ncbi:MAG: hypothetical protein NE327_09965 [Lentisphaeraceae bacterium]|nr:hypothetical protein [Lentisphaeraceae bacterium]
MKRFSIVLILILTSTTHIHADDNIIKCLNLIASLNKTYAAKATKYLEKAKSKQVFSDEQKAILDTYITLGQFLQLSIQQKKEKGPSLAESFPIFKECFICKGTRIADKKVKCKNCKGRGVCKKCKGRNSAGGTILGGANYDSPISIDPCKPCEQTGICQTCKGDKFLETDCDKCYLTDGKIDSLKARAFFKKSQEEYLNLPMAGFNKKAEKIPENLERFSGPFPKIKSERNVYNGLFVNDRGKLVVIFAANDFINPLQLKCSFDGNALRIDEIEYSSKFKCFKLIVNGALQNIKVNKLGSFDAKKPGFIFFPFGEDKSYQPFEQVSKIELQDSYNGFSLVQEDVVTCLVGNENIIQRVNVVDNWIRKKTFVKSSVKPVLIKEGFLKSFQWMDLNDLKNDFTILSSYLQLEGELFKSIQQNNKNKLDSTIAKMGTVRNFISGRKLKTDWAKDSSNLFSNTVEQLEKLIFSK